MHCKYTVMKRSSSLSFLHLFLGFALILLYACSKDSNPTIQEIPYSQSFSIQDLGQGKKLITDSRNRTFLLLPKKLLQKTQNSPPKTVESYSSKTLVDKTKVLGNHAIENHAIQDRAILQVPEIEGLFEIPLDRIVLGSSTQASFLKALGVLDRVIAVPFSKKTWALPEIRQGLENQTLYSIGEPHKPDLERIRVLKPSLGFVYAGLGLQQIELMQAFNRFQVPYIVANPHMERTLLGKLSWILFFSVFFQKEAKAKEYLQKAHETIQSIQKKTQNLPNKKKIIWASVYQGLFYTPSKNSYVHDLIQIAGGIIPFPEAKRFHQLTPEEFYFHAKDAEIFILTTTLPKNIRQLTQESHILKALRSIQEKQVWQIHPDWHQNLHQLPQQTQELSQILYPKLWNNPKDPKHFIRLK